MNNRKYETVSFAKLLDLQRDLPCAPYVATEHFSKRLNLFGYTVSEWIHKQTPLKPAHISIIQS